MPASSESSERDRAVRDFEEGRRAHLAGRLEKAELFYLRAWARMKSYDIATNLGQVQLLLNKPASAAKYLAFGVRTVGPEIEPERLLRMQAMLDEAKARVGTLRVRVTNVADAEVLLDGGRVPEEEAKHELYLEPGQHALVIRRAGYEEAVIPVAAVAGSHEEITRELKPKAATRSGAAGALLIGDAKPKAPAAGARVEAQRSWVPVIALGAASAVGLGVGVGFTVASNSANDEAHAQSRSIRDAGGQCVAPSVAFTARCAELDRLGAEADGLGTAAFGSYIASGVSALAAVTCALWPRRAGTISTVLSVRPDLRLNGGGIVAVGTW
ncbi:hypothetical protein WME75_37880 [Sorangium sp. So ce1014]|uniref:PEGA domain-containing protein n=1 Tax=Sorangium sp. So ce1014 TaxID=3133326 RepID=UPI003F634D67